MKVGFISWDGPDQNYMESLFFPIFERAAQSDIDFSVLQFTWGPEEIRRSIGRAARDRGIDYESRPVLRKPLNAATAAMIVRGAASVVFHARRHDIDVLMPKQIMPAAMCMMARPLLPDIRIVFDTDGFMADERVDFGGWDSEGMVYRLFRSIEARACRRADAVVSRTERGRDILIERAGPGVADHKIFVVPNGKDTEQFAPLPTDERASVRDQWGIPEKAPWVIYAGSLGPHYHPESIFDAFEAIRQRAPGSRLTILTGHKEVARDIHKARSIEDDAVDIMRVHPDEVAPILGAGDLGIAFRTPSFSQQGVCPIKIAEYLLCGLPVLCTSGVGDLDRQIDEKVGMMVEVEDLNPAGMEGIAQWFVDEVLPNRDGFRSACRARGKMHFGLDRCAAQLRDVLQFGTS